MNLFFKLAVTFLLIGLPLYFYYGRDFMRLEMKRKLYNRIFPGYLMNGILMLLGLFTLIASFIFLIIGIWV